MVSLFMIRQPLVDPGDRLIKRQPADRNARWECRKQPRGHRRRQDDEDPAIALPPDQPAERLGEARPHYAVVIGASAPLILSLSKGGHAPRGV